MKKIISLLVVFIFLFSFAKAQEPAFSLGDKVVNIGIGLGNALYTGSGYKGSIPPVSISFEKGIKDNVLEKGTIGVGGYLGYSSYKWEYLNWGWKYTNIIIGARGNFHYPLVDKLDTYVGILLGYNIATSKEFGTSIGYDYSASSGGFIWSGYIGGRYFFNDSLAALVELGSGISYLTLGIAVKF